MASVNIVGLTIAGVATDNLITGPEDLAGGFAIVGTTMDIEPGQMVTGTITDPNGLTTAPISFTIAADGTWTTAPDSLPNSFFVDGVYTVNGTATDAAGNVATAAPFTFTVDETGPAYSVDSIIYDDFNGTITINGDFSELTAADTVDVTTAIWQDGDAPASIPVDHADFVETAGALAATTWFGSATQVVLTWNGGAQGVFEPVGTVGGAAADTIDLGAGLFTDGDLNTSDALTGLEITLDIRTSLQGNDLTGQGGDDTFLANTGGATDLTGGAGADTFLFGQANFGVLGSGTAAESDIDDYVSGEDTIQFFASQLNNLDPSLAGVFAAGEDASEVAFVTYDGVGAVNAVAATTLAGTFIFDANNSELRFDTLGDTSYNGVNVLEGTGADDLIISLTGVTALNADDISFI